MNPYMAQAIGQTLQQELARRGSAGLRQQQMNIIGLDAERKKTAEILADSEFKREMLAQKFKDEQEKLQAAQLIRDAQDAMRAKAIRGLSKAPVSEDGGAGVPGIPSESDLADAGKLFEALGPERAQAFIDRLNVAKPDEIDNIYKEIQAAAVDSLKAQDARKQLEAMLAPGSPAIPGQPAIPDVMGFRGRWETGGELTERPAGMIGPPMTAPERYVKQAGSPEVPGVPEVPPGEYRRILGDSVELLRPEIDADPVKALGTIRSAAFAEQTRQGSAAKSEANEADSFLLRLAMPNAMTGAVPLENMTDEEVFKLAEATGKTVDPAKLALLRGKRSGTGGGGKGGGGRAIIPWDGKGVPQLPTVGADGNLTWGDGGTTIPPPQEGGPIIPPHIKPGTPAYFNIIASWQRGEQDDTTKDQIEAGRLAGVVAQIMDQYGNTQKRLSDAKALLANPTKTALLSPTDLNKVKAIVPMLEAKRQQEESGQGKAGWAGLTQNQKDQKQKEWRTLQSKLYSLEAAYYSAKRQGKSRVDFRGKRYKLEAAKQILDEAKREQAALEQKYGYDNLWEGSGFNHKNKKPVKKQSWQETLKGKKY